MNLDLRWSSVFGCCSYWSATSGALPLWESNLELSELVLSRVDFSSSGLITSKFSCLSNISLLFELNLNVEAGDLAVIYLLFDIASSFYMCFSSKCSHSCISWLSSCIIFNDLSYA